MSILLSEIQKLSPSAIIELFEIDLTPKGGTVLRFHAGSNELSQNLVFNGLTYTRYPVEVSGFAQSGTGGFPRPILKASNALSAITILLLQYNDMAGVKFTRIRTLKKYLDAVNFVGGTNPSANPSAKFDDDIYYIEQKKNESIEYVEFEMVSGAALDGVKLPRRQIIQNSCPFAYRGADCGYTGTNYFDRNDNPVTDSTKDVCGKKLNSCEVRFGAGSELPYGGFPAAGLISG
jgi:lambda family phage minor tail protein L